MQKNGDKFSTFLKKELGPVIPHLPLTAQVLDEDSFFGDYHYFEELKQFIGHVWKGASKKEKPEAAAVRALPKIYH